MHTLADMRNVCGHASPPLHLSTFLVCVFITQINFLPCMGVLITQSDYLAQQSGHKGFYQQISVRFTGRSSTQTLLLSTD